MPTSDHTQCCSYGGTLKKVAAVLGLTLCTGAGLLWINQQAIERYWQQTRHAPSPLSDFSPAWWQAGASIEEALQTRIQQLTLALMPAQDIAADTPVVDDTEVDNDDSDIPVTAPAPGLTMDDISGQPAPNGTPLDMATPTGTSIKQPAANMQTPESSSTTTSDVTHNRPSVITLAPNDRVLFIGDSMMQGIAPHVMKTLLKQYHVQSTNLSLQSTGLAYPNAFDWPGTLRTTLANTADIKVLVVFLGPNDPWDMPSRARGPYLKFKTPAWEAEYRSRIRNIIDQATARNIAVIWVGPPAMKRVALSEGVRFLDTLYQSEVEAAGQYYIAVDDLFGYQDHRYSDPVTLDGRQVRLRSDDGTHFTVTGQKVIARAVLSLLQPVPTESEPTRPAPAAEEPPQPVQQRNALAPGSAAEKVFADPTAAHPAVNRRAADAARVFTPRS